MPPPPGYQPNAPIVVTDPDDGSFSTVQTIFLAGGGYVVVWTEAKAGQGTDVWAQLFDAAGDRIGDDFLVNDGRGGQPGRRQGRGAVVGRLRRHLDHAAAREVRAQFFDETGQKVGDEFQVSATGFPSVSADIVTLMSGNIVIVWHESAEPNGAWAGSGLRWAEYEPSGALAATGTAAEFNGQVPHVAALDYGGFVVSYTSEANRFDLYPTGVNFVVVEQGVPRQGRTSNYSSMPGEQHAIAGLETGGFVVVWATARGQGGQGPANSVYAQIFAADRTPLGDRFLISADTDNFSFKPQVVGVPGMGFAVTWASDGSADVNNIHVQLFANDGTKIGDEFTAHDSPAGYQGDPSIASDGFGSILMAWADAQQAGSDYEVNILARLFVLPNAAATTGDDLLAGTAGADTIRGGTGDDSYLVNHDGDRPLERPGEGIDTVFTSISYTLAGNTNVEGLETTDAAGTDPLHLTGNLVYNRIVGNAGNNRIDGGLGKDELIGLGGNDTYLVDNAGDRIVEAAGGGIDAVYSSVSYTLADGQEVEGLMTSVWEANVAIDLTGNGFDNQLIGNAGRNRLDGGGGRDTMLGREGDDVYVVDRLSDLVIEYAGQGADIIYAPFSYSLNDSQEVEGLSARIWEATDAIDLTGNGLANYLIGNAGAQPARRRRRQRRDVRPRGRRHLRHRQRRRPGVRIFRPGRRHHLQRGQLQPQRRARRSRACRRSPGNRPPRST